MMQGAGAAAVDYGGNEAYATIELVNGRGVVMIDPIDLAQLSRHRWYFLRKRNGDGGYAWRRAVDPGTRKQVSIYMHRQIMGLGSHRDDPVEVDHANGNGLDNRRANLRIASRAQNAVNRQRSMPKSRAVYSRFRGVYSSARAQPGDRRTAHLPERRVLAERRGTDARARRARKQNPERFAILLDAAENLLSLDETAQLLGGVSRERARQLFHAYGVDRRKVASKCHTSKWYVVCGGQHVAYGYDSEEEAAMRYNVEARRRYGEFAVLNQVEMG